MQYQRRAPLWLSALVSSGALALGEAEARRADDDVFETEKCVAAVNEVNKTGSYSEESITPVCDKHMKWKECDFFAEALSLASSHQDFNKTGFCQNMEEAHFCSGRMNDLLSSVPVSDLAFGECLRAEPKRSDEYCKKFQKMLAYAVKEDYLDTIRACYMIESYGNMTAEKKDKEATPAPPTTTQPPQGRIIVSSSKELDRAGKGKATPGNSPPQAAAFGKEGIVVKPEPLTDIGDGKGNMKGKPAAPGPAPSASSPVAASETKPAAAEAKSEGSIIVEPVPAKGSIIKESVAAKDAGAKEALVAKSVVHPAPAAKAVAVAATALRSRAVAAVAATRAPEAKAAKPAASSRARGAVAAKANVTAVHSHVVALAAHPSKVTAAAKEKVKKDTTEKVKKDTKDGYGGFMSSFVSL